MKAHGYAAKSESSGLAPFEFERRELKPNDVLLEILYCGISHSDLHVVKNEWKGTNYPVVPGHEIIGRVVAIGDKVKNFDLQETVAIGCIVDSCRKCSSCKENLEQYCEEGFTLVFNATERESKEPTFGGFSDKIVIDANYLLKVPKNFTEKQLPAVAPILCAGITTYSPLRHWKVGKNSKIGIVGCGGLGHMAVKLAHAMGAHVTLFTTSPEKVTDGKKLGADEVVLSNDKEEMKKRENTLDFILNTVAMPHNLNNYLALLKKEGTLCLVGLPPSPHPSPQADLLITKRRQIAGSLIGGIKETQELLEFCAEHGVTADIELIPIQKVNEALERMAKGDVKYRFVIDMSSLIPFAKNKDTC